jgi:hypothetical protein
MVLRAIISKISERLPGPKRPQAAHAHAAAAGHRPENGNKNNPPREEEEEEEQK